MTDLSPRSQTRPRPHVRVAGSLAVVIVLAAAALAPAVLGGGGTVVVTTIPGGGWIQSPDNTAGGTAALVAGPAAGRLGNGSLELTVAANTDFAGVEHPYLAGIPFADLTAASWRTFVTGATGNPDAEPASLRFTGYQDGVFPFTGFTTLVVELVYNDGVTPNVWQDTAVGDPTTVWQTNPDDGFCQVAALSRCTLAEFKAEYPDARFFGIQVGIGTGIPPVTSYADGVSISYAGVTDTFDFEIAGTAATPTPTPTPIATPVPPGGASATPIATPAGGSGAGGDGGEPARHQHGGSELSARPRDRPRRAHADFDDDDRGRLEAPAQPLNLRITGSGGMRPHPISHRRTMAING